MARKNFGAKPLTLPQPVWIIATYDENGVPNAMNAAWGGISESNEITLCLSVGHKTCKNFEKTGAFTISMADAAHVAGCDYVGISSGNKTEDKFSKAGFTATKSELVNAPIINELAVCLECKLKSFDHDSCILKGEIVNVSVDEAALTEGKVDIAKVAPIAFDPFNNAYHVLGEKVGDAWGSGKELLQKLDKQYILLYLIKMSCLHDKIKRNYRVYTTFFMEMMCFFLYKASHIQREGQNVIIT